MVGGKGAGPERKKNKSRHSQFLNNQFLNIGGVYLLDEAECIRGVREFSDPTLMHIGNHEMNSAFYFPSQT